MKFDDQVTIDGTIYNLVRAQRDGFSAIYKSSSRFLRIGSPEKINKILLAHKDLEKYNFPVARLLGEGKLDDMDYFFEESMGDSHFGELFERDMKKLGFISDEMFNQFLDIIIKFTLAQLKTITGDKEWSNFEHTIHLDLLCSEIPENKEKIIDTYNKHKKKLEIFPFVIIHGDLTPFNIYPTGIIDFENSSVGPAGFDLGAIIQHLFWFPESTEYEYYRLYNFSPEQVDLFLKTIDQIYIEHGLPKISDYLPEFNFTKGLWFTANNRYSPKLAQFRYSLIRTLF